MGPTGSEASDSSNEETPLIRGLPDDVAILCLVRVPRTYHLKLKCVSKRWRKLVCGEEWRNIRKKYNLEETWIYAFCQNGYGNGRVPKYCCYVLDPYASRRRWKPIRNLPPCIEKRQWMKFEVLGQKAYLIGGRDYTESEYNSPHTHTSPNIVDEVHCYDGTTNSWSKAAPLSTPRCYFASEVLDGKIYVVGSQLNPDGKHTWESYDPVTNIWKSKSDPRVMENSIESFVYNGKLYVRYAIYVDLKLSGFSGVVYDPSTGIWHDAENEFMSRWHGKSVVADGKLYTFDEMWYKLMIWEEAKKKWMLLVDLGSVLMMSGPPVHYHLVAVGKSIFFIFNGLRTVELDVSNVAKGGGVLPISIVNGSAIFAGSNRSRYLPFYHPTLGEVPEVGPVICKGMAI